MVFFFPVQTPGGEAGEPFRNRHHKKSLNVLLFAGATGKIFVCSSKNAGKKHDASILMNLEQLIEDLESGAYVPFRDAKGDVAIIAADSAFPGTYDWLATTVPSEVAFENEFLMNYNEKFILAR